MSCEEIMSESIQEKIFFEKFKAGSMIGEGSFGKCFMGLNLQSNEEICMKIEKKNSKNTFLEQESIALILLKDGKGIPEFYLYGCTDNYNILIMELLGNSLQNEFTKNNHIFSICSVSRIIIQAVSKNY